MRNFYFVTVSAIACLVLLGFSQKLHATHAQGFDLSYQCLGGNTYQFTLNFYRDCDGISAPNAVNINLSSVSCSSDFNINLGLSGVATEVSPLCAAQLAQSTCATPACVVCLPGVEQYVYQGTFTFTQNCPDWVVSFEECCRNNSITNLNGPGGRSLFVSAALDNSGGLCNSSPQFTSTPVPYVCADQQFCYNHGAIDPDGDSLSYSLVNPLEGPAPGTPIPYSSPALSANYPLFDTTGSVQFDPQTGSLCIIPTDTTPGQVVVVAVQVLEWRNGVVIGSTTRDIQLVVLQCANNQPDLNPRDVVNLNGGIRVDSNSIEICPGVPLTFDIIADDPNLGDVVTMSTNVLALIPAATFNTSGTNPVTGSFSWTPTVADAGFYNFTVTIQDDGCPILGAQIFNFDITVVPSTDAGPDVTYCPAGGPVSLNAVGGTTFTWSDIGGGGANFSCNPCQNTDVDIVNTTQIEVLSDLSPVCKNRDTVIVTLVPDFTLNTSNDTTICRYGLAQLNSSATPTGGGFSPYVFSWSPSDSLSADSIANPLANPVDSTDYVVTVTSAAGCTIRDTISVNINGVAPQVVIAPADTVCFGEDVDLNSVIFQDCGTTAITCSGPPAFDTIGSGNFVSQDFGPFILDATNQIANKRQYLFRPADLAALGLQGGGRINSFGLEVVSAGDPINGVEIRMGCVPETFFPSASFFTGLTLVKAPFTWNPVAGFSDQILDFPYMWDGQSSLVVEVCVDPLQALGSPSTVRFDNYGVNVTNIANNLVGGACADQFGSPVFNRPRARFNTCEALPPTITYAWTPPTFLNDPSLSDPTATPTATTTYTLNVQDGVCVGTDQVTVVASPLFNIDAGPDSVLCLNEPYPANPNLDPGTYTYSWSPASGVSDPNIANPVISAPDTTTYILTATSADNCTLTDSLTISIDGVAPFVNVTEDTAICPGVGLAALSTTISQNCGLTSNTCTGPVASDEIEDPVGFATSIYGAHFIFQSLNATLRRQYIFTATELDTMGLVAGHKISSIAIEYTTANDTKDNVIVKMGCTSQDSFDNSLTFIPNLDVVMTATSIPPVVGYTTFPFTTDYVWDGVSNLVVEICSSVGQAGSSPTSASDARVHTVGGNAFRTLYYNSFAGLDACAQATGDARAFFRPNMRFTHCEALPGGLTYSWAPSAGLSNATIPNPVATPTVSTTYTLTVSGGGSCDGGDQVTVAIDSTNFVSGTSTPQNSCPTPTYQLDATVAGPPFYPNLPSCGVNGTACTQPLYSAQVGTGNTSSGTFYSPFFNSQQNMRIQYLYRASDLTAAGVGSGTITAIGVTIAQADSLDLDGISIGMTCTSLNNLSIANGFQNITTVLGPVAYNPINGLAIFTLANPFDWDGTSNLIVEFCNTNAITSTTPSLVEYTTNTGHNGTMINFDNVTPGCNLGVGGATVNPGFINMQFTVCPPPPNPLIYNWMPAVGVSNPLIANPVYTDPDPSTADTLLVLVSGGACDIVDTVIIPSCILPVELFQLEARQAGDDVQLDWKTLNEVNVREYIVYRIEDGLVELGRVDAAGNTNGLTPYDFLDEAPNPGENRYVVHAMDMNGSMTESNEVTVTFDRTSGLVNLYPNPAQTGSGFFIEFFAADPGMLSIVVTDMWGREVMRQENDLDGGMELLEVSTLDLAQGTYIVELKFGGKADVRKLMLVD